MDKHGQSGKANITCRLHNSDNHYSIYAHLTAARKARSVDFDCNTTEVWPLVSQYCWLSLSLYLAHSNVLELQHTANSATPNMHVELGICLITNFLYVLLL